jgi:tetratricopeptide (TPR) repeat protein
MAERLSRSRLTARIPAGPLAIRLSRAVPLAAAVATLLSGCTQPRVPSEQERVRQMRMDMLQRRAQARALARQAGDKIDQKKYKEARSLLEKALAEDPFSFAAQNNLGVLYLEERSYYDAARAFEQASKLEPHSALPYYNLGRLMDQTGRPEEAARQYELGLARDPDFLPAIEQLAQSYMRLDRNPAQVKDLLERAAKLERRPEWLEWLAVQRALLAASTQPASAPAAPTMPAGASAPPP